MADRREGVNRGFRDWSTLVLCLRTFTAIEIRLQQLAPIRLLDPDRLVRHSQERKCYPAVSLFSNVRVHWTMLPRDVHYPVPPVDGGGYQSLIGRYPLDEVEDGEYDRHDNDLRVVVESSCARYDDHDQMDMRIWGGFRTAIFLADPQPQRERQPWSRVFRCFWKGLLRCNTVA